MYPDLEVLLIYTAYHVFKELLIDCRDIDIDITNNDYSCNDNNI